MSDKEAPSGQAPEGARIIRGKALAAWLGYRTTDALRKALARGLDAPCHREGGLWAASVEALEEWIAGKGRMAKEQAEQRAAERSRR